MKLNLGSGKCDWQKDWVRADLDELCDVRLDAEESLPFKDGSFDEVLCSHILEHIYNLKQLQEELRRVTKSFGRVVIESPYYTSPDAWGDPTHVRGISCQSFNPHFWKGFDLESLGFRVGVKEFLNEPITSISVVLRRK